MMEEDNSRKVFLSVLGVAILLVAVVGVSFALYSTGATGKDNSISTGTITMSYTEPTNGILLENALPISDDAGKKLTGDKNVFTFTVATTASGTVTVPYEINITKETSTLADSAVAVYLTKGTTTETEVVPKQLMSAVVLDSNKSALREDAYKLYETSVAYENGTVKTGEATTTYNLRIWVDANADANTIKDQEYKIKVNVDSKVNAIGQ